MDAIDRSIENPIEQLAALQQEVAELKIAKLALEAQNQMLENLLKMAESPELEEILQVTLQQAVDISSKLTGAESGCLVFLDASGVVKESIPKQDELTPMQMIFASQGYINWVDSHRQAVAIADVLEVESLRSLFLEPPLMRSVLNLPILKKQKLLGVLTLMHSEPGYFGPVIANFMQSIAKQIALTVEYAQLYSELENYSHQLKQELEIGREIQRDFLPNPIVSLPGWELAATIYPARQVAGDFYDTFLFPDGSVGLVIGDVCDKGVGAALFMGLFRSLLRIFSGQYSFLLPNISNGHSSEGEVHESPPNTVKISEALKAIMLTNNYIAQNHERLCMFATIFFGVLNPISGVLTYINGGHVPPIVVRANGTTERLKPTGPAVGPLLNTDFQIEWVQLEPGDMLIGFSDGVTDARSPEGTAFTEKRLLSLLEEPVSTAGAMLDLIKQQLKSHIAEADPFDDITILAVQQVPALSTN